MNLDMPRRTSDRRQTTMQKRQVVQHNFRARVRKIATALSTSTKLSVLEIQRETGLSRSFI